jgi:hypothetical protein
MRIKTPKEGEYRYIWEYIWFPTHFSNVGWVWLERVYIKQVWIGIEWYNVYIADPKTNNPI